jgi:hypothetical protein
VTGPVLLSEPRMLAVAAGHRFARRRSVSLDEVAGETVVRTPCSLPDDRSGPGEGPAARTGGQGHAAETFQEALTLVAAGRGVFAVGAHAARYHARPDVVYLPLVDVPPLEWGLVWPATRGAARVRAFAEAAHEAGRVSRSRMPDLASLTRPDTAATANTHGTATGQPTMDRRLRGGSAATGATRTAGSTSRPTTTAG